jgi:hypothetical protein
MTLEGKGTLPYAFEFLICGPELGFLVLTHRI